MYDLQVYVRGALSADTDLLAIFNRCGLPGVCVLPFDQREEAAYPRILLDIAERGTMEYADNAPPLFVDGEITLEIVTEKNDTVDQPLLTLLQLVEQVKARLLGDPDKQLSGMKGKAISDRYNVTRLSQSNSRRLVSSPNYPRHRITHAVQLHRTARRSP